MEILIFCDKFNQPLLNNSLSSLHNLRELTFDSKFNQFLNNSLSNLVNLRELTFGHSFNQPLSDSLSKLVDLRKLTLGYNFDQLIDIPEWIKKLTINCNCQHIIDYLPSNIVELEFGYDFILELNDLLSSIKKIKILNWNYNKKLYNLPSGIEQLEISENYKYIQMIDFKYKNLNVVYF